ncbi:hypothetical protein [Helicobacter heilmannii]|uniref:hypothetical protein n=1 Tax=Helicobacter heilmannii TaxID=35817 RepID=UPI0006A1D6D8|nr:hypothetical protein [Helicobacter heilmannii]GMB95375.1 hypothetical protein NHP21011_14810 [Helicobacter heilmannii]CRF49020.1 PUTATIVE MCP-TYPE SIGNAL TRANSDUCTION PROTEIN [Helicobacter heilmannii]
MDELVNKGLRVMLNEKLKLSIDTMSFVLSKCDQNAPTPEAKKQMIDRLLKGFRFEKDHSSYFFVYDLYTTVSTGNPKFHVGANMEIFHNKNGVYNVDISNLRGGFLQPANNINTLQKNIVNSPQHSLDAAHALHQGTNALDETTSSLQVVADDMRKLAERTQKSLDEIEANTSTLTEFINRTALVIEDWSENIAQINTAMGSLEKTMAHNTQIAQTSSTISQNVQRIAQNILEKLTARSSRNINHYGSGLCPLKLRLGCV